LSWEPSHEQQPHQHHNGFDLSPDALDYNGFDLSPDALDGDMPNVAADGHPMRALDRVWAWAQENADWCGFAAGSALVFAMLLFA
jgi:hypothetical protein